MHEEGHPLGRRHRLFLPDPLLLLSQLEKKDFELGAVHIHGDSSWGAHWWVPRRWLWLATGLIKTQVPPDVWCIELDIDRVEIRVYRVRGVFGCVCVCNYLQTCLPEVRESVTRYGVGKGDSLSIFFWRVFFTPKV